MENRERDRVSQRTSPTEAGQLNRKVSEEQGREQNSGTSAEFGQSIGRAENLSEGGEMRNRNDRQDSDLKNTSMGNESSRKQGSGSFGSSSGRSSGSMGSSSDISREEKSPGRGGSGTLGSTGSSEGRH